MRKNLYLEYKLNSLLHNCREHKNATGTSITF